MKGSSTASFSFESLGISTQQQNEIIYHDYKANLHLTFVLLNVTFLQRLINQNITRKKITYHNYICSAHNHTGV